MGDSDFFSYLSAFVTIMLAVALTDIIQSTHRLLRGRRRVKWDALPLIFALLVAISVVSEFFALWDRVAIPQVSMERLLWLLLQPTVMALLAYSVLPDEVPETGLNLTEFYDSERQLWAMLLAIILLLDMIRSVELFLMKGDPLRDLFEYAGPLLLVMAVGLTLMAFSRSRVGQVLAIALIAGAILYATLGWTIGATVAA